MGKRKMEKKLVLDVIENVPGSKLMINRCKDDPGIEVQLQSFGECSKRMIVTGARVLRVESVQETVTFRVPEDEKGQASGLEGLAKSEVLDTVDCVLCHLDDGRTIQLSQAPLVAADYRVIDGRLEWPADDRPRL